MAGRRRSKNGDALLAFDPAIHAFFDHAPKDVNARHKAGQDVTVPIARY
jgi:hypothetical protein